jgi:hypothetical protein
MRWDYASELLPPMGLMIISQVIYKHREPRSNGIDRGKSKNSEINLSQCHSVYHKSNMEWPGHKPGSSRWVAGRLVTNRLGQGMAYTNVLRAGWAERPPRAPRGAPHIDITMHDMFRAQRHLKLQNGKNVFEQRQEYTFYFLQLGFSVWYLA